MFSARSALLVAAAGVALTAGFAMPAEAATVGSAPLPPGGGLAPTTCFQAQQYLATAQNELAVARQNDADEDSTVSGSVDFTPDTNDGYVSTANGYVNTEQQYVNALCGGVTGVGLPGPVPVPTPNPVPGTLNCAQILAAYGRQNIPIGDPLYRTYLDRFQDGIACETGVSTGTIRTVHGHKCSFNGTTWVPVTSIPVGTPLTVNGTPCHWSGTTWVPVTTVTAPAPCNCTSTPSSAPVTATAPAPSTINNNNSVTVNTASATQPSSVDIVSSPPQVITVPSQSGSSFSQIGGTTPAGAAATGDGSLADVADPNPNPDPTASLTVDLGDILQVVTLPSIPGLPAL